MTEFSKLDLKKVKSIVKQDVVITGSTAAFFLCHLIKTEGKGCRTVEALFNKLKLSERYELVVRRKRGMA